MSLQEIARKSFSALPADFFAKSTLKTFPIGSWTPWGEFGEFQCVPHRLLGRMGPGGLRDLAGPWGPWTHSFFTHRVAAGSIFIVGHAGRQKVVWLEQHASQLFGVPHGPPFRLVLPRAPQGSTGLGRAPGP